MVHDAERGRMMSDYAARRQRVIDAFNLTPADLVRMGTMTADDPICAYAGHLEIQASMIADERNGHTAELPLPPNIVPGEN